MIDYFGWGIVEDCIGVGILDGDLVFFIGVDEIVVKWYCDLLEVVFGNVFE